MQPKSGQRRPNAHRLGGLRPKPRSTSPESVSRLGSKLPTSTVDVEQCSALPGIPGGRAARQLLCIDGRPTRRHADRQQSAYRNRSLRHPEASEWAKALELAEVAGQGVVARTVALSAHARALQWRRAVLALAELRGEANGVGWERGRAPGGLQRARGVEREDPRQFPQLCPRVACCVGQPTFRKLGRGRPLVSRSRPKLTESSRGRPKVARF